MVNLSIRLRACQLVNVLHVMTLLGLVLAEPFHQRRDFLDQNKYVSFHNDNVVKDRNDAKFVLSKYGYLRCQIRRRRREAMRTGDRGFGRGSSVDSGGDNSFNPWADFDLSEEGGSPVCDEAEVQKAIREYQRTYNLPATGVLDEETKVLMSTSRCGNKDNEVLEKKNETATSVTSTTTATTTLPVASSIPLPHSENVHIGLGSSNKASSHNQNGHHHHSAQKLLEDSNRSGIVHSQRLWKRAVNRIYKDDNSQLLRVLQGAVSRKHLAQSRHKRHLREFVANLRREDPAILEPYTEEQRSKRSIQVTAMRQAHEFEGFDLSQTSNEEMFRKEVIRWRLLTTGYSTRIPVEDQRATIDLAFRMWSEVIPLRFMEDTTSDINNVDIEVAFGRGSHQNCAHDFDGNGGEIAHSQHAGNMHFDDEENFKSIHSYTPDGIYLLRVAVHEIGHVLGLQHTNKSHSIMYAIYHGAEQSPEFELSRDDRREVQKIYGVCKGKFSTVFDWVRKRPDHQFIYNTYFFRDNQYWMYENHANRTRYGDPLYIAREWKGVPNAPDGYLHMWYFTGTDIVDEAFIFKGEHYYKYNSDNDQVYEGWPKLISQNFGPKPGDTEGIPDNIDTVFFDMRDKNIYFFKDDMVFVYDPKEPEESRGCCVRKRKIIEEFPAAEGHDPLPEKLDAVYYSYQDKMMYFFKGENLWRNKVFDPRQRRIHNSVELVGKWYDRWMDICDVQTA